ncbi:MAG: dihydrolipoyl dehydrogenase [Gammaproteobacteria bacterium]|jgi:dihydrolipoamide dehydrogenase|nr:dihydrolipoyl dehydrogenase [Gammaproteobacteria bacterium]
MAIEVKVPNLGDFSDVEIIEINVGIGDELQVEDPVLSLETDKATMEIPSPAAGTVESVSVKVGDKVSEGDLLLTMNEIKSERKAVENSANKPIASAPANSNADHTTEIVVLGSGPGGYTAAFRAADLGKKVVLVERYSSLGGVCLNVGCIPSKALLHAAKVISEAKEVKEFGIEFAAPTVDLDKLRGWKEKVLGQLTNGLKGLAKQRKVEVLHGEGKFVAANQMSVNTREGEKIVNFEQAIIAAGSQASKVPVFPDDPRIIDSTGALELKEIPKRMLIIGGGIIGLEMATVYHELGAEITVVEMLDNIIAGADADVVKPLLRRIQKQYKNIYLSTRVTEIKALKKELQVSFDGAKAPDKESFDVILVAVGRRPNGHKIGADSAGIEVNEQGFIPVDKQQRTNVGHIYAIGDIVGQPMLAHKAVHEGKVAAEVIAGMKSAFDARVIPSVAYTDPEVAWVGVTESEAKEQGLKFGKGVFPWAASGRSLSLGRNEGMSKLLFDEETDRVIGAGICGPNAGDLIAEVALAIEMDCDATDLSLTIHPHPTLSETVAFAAEMFEGTITDLIPPKKK